jgi:mRNA interferase MazF
MARVLRGDILWADLNPVKGHEQAGLRPVLILSPEVFNERSGTVIALALTSQPQRAGFPLTLELTSADLPKPTWVKISQIRTLSVERLGKRMGHVSDDEMSQVVEGLNETIGEQSAAGYRP